MFNATTVSRLKFLRHYTQSRLSLIVRVNVVLNRTVVVDQTQPTFEMTPGFKPFTDIIL